MMHDPPDAAELAASVSEFLAAEVLPVVSGHVRYHTRVAMTILATVEREIRLGHAQAAAHATRLASLGFDTEVALARAIRDGQVDYTDPQLLAAVRETVDGKVAVANPAYREGSPL